MGSNKFTEAEKAALFEFRSRLDDLSLRGKLESTENDFLIRWLRARNLDIKNATVMLSNYMVWRDENEDYKIAFSGDYIPPPRVLSEFKFKSTGLDNEGRLVIWLPIARYDCKGLLESGLKSDCIRYCYQMLNEIQTEINKQAKVSGMTQFVALIDSAELTFRKITHYETLQCLVRFMKEFDAYYPELLHSCYVVNAPWLFSTIFNLVKPVLSANTLGKINIFDSDQEKWQKALLERLPSAALPEEYGGTGPPVLTAYEKSS